MPSVEVNGVNVAYEIVGEGTPLIWSPGGWDGIDAAFPVAEAFAARGYRVLIWDRPTTHRSDLVWVGDSLLGMWADFLHEAADKLGFNPAIVGGGSGGFLTSLSYGFAFPDSVSVLLLVSPMSDDAELWRNVNDSCFLEPARLAKEEGMQAVIDHDGGFFKWGQQVQKKPEKRSILLDTDPAIFADAMARWEKKMTPHAGLSDGEIEAIEIPAIIVSGWDSLHPTHAAQKMHNLYSESQLLLWYDVISEEDTEHIRKVREAGEKINADTYLVPYLDDFIRLKTKEN